MIKEIFFPLSVGLMLFFTGMKVMQTGLFNLAGNRLKKILLQFTRTPVHGFVTGTITTAIVQSSSAVTLLTIALTGSRMLTFPQTVGIILGANVGTTITTEILALDLTKHAVYIFLSGAALWFVPVRILRCFALFIGGFGLIFLGLDLIQWIARPVMELPFFTGLIEFGNDNSVIGILFGTVMTAIIQSSTATTAITMSFMHEYLIPLSMGIAIILGSNVGTCITAWLGSLGGSIEGKRVAWAHILINVFGVLLFIPLIGVLSVISTTLTADPPAQLAHAQTIFNVLCSLIALPFANPFARLVTWLIPAKPPSDS